MINLTISKTTDTNGATLYTLTPSPVVLGNQNANAVDEVQVAGIPAEWDGLTIRAVFVPTPGAAVACILDENGRCTVSASFTGNRGEIVVDAFGEDYHAYTTPARYAVARHQDISATVDPEYTPTQVEQILAQAQTYANDAQDARDAAQEAAESIQDMTVSAETLPAGSDASVTKTETPTGIHLEIGIPRGADGQVQDVTLDGTSIVTGGVAAIPKATANNVFGLFKANLDAGTQALSDGRIATNPATTTNIDGRTSTYKPITPTNLDYAVKRALTDGVGTAYTDAEIAAAQTRLGVEQNPLRLDSNGYLSVPNAPTTTKWTGQIGVLSSGQLTLATITDAIIDGRTSSTPQLLQGGKIDYAVKAAMTDGRGAAWTAAEQLAGRQRLGFGDVVELINTTTTSAYTLILDTTGYRKIILTSSAPILATGGTSGYARLYDSDNHWANLLYYQAYTFGSTTQVRSAVFTFEIYDEFASALLSLANSTTTEFQTTNYTGFVLKTYAAMNELRFTTQVPEGVTLKAYGIRA